MKHGQTKLGIITFGGSKALGYSTKTSDEDYFVIGNINESHLIKEGERTDIEHRDLSWLKDMLQKLENYTVSSTLEPPVLSFYDMRFIVRVIMGHTVYDVGNIKNSIQSVYDNLRNCCINYYNIIYNNLYEDILGLTQEKRTIEAISLIGSLISNCNLLCLLNRKLVDISPKWALHNSKGEDFYESIKNLTLLTTNLNQKNLEQELYKLLNKTRLLVLGEYLGLNEHLKNYNLTDFDLFLDRKFCPVFSKSFLTFYNVFDKKIYSLPLTSILIKKDDAKIESIY